MKYLKYTGAILVAAMLCVQTHAQDKVYYGLLHAHTLFSDGSGTPEDAYKMAKANKLDFFAVTPHNHADAEQGAKERADNVLIALQPELYNGNNNVTVNRQFKDPGKNETKVVKPLLKTAKDEKTATFIPLYGQEYSSISSGNHMNVLGIDHVITVPNGDFKGLVAELKKIQQAGGNVPVLQLNHPEVHNDLFYKGNDEGTKDHMFNDYGIDPGDLGPHFKNMVAALDPYVDLIEILSGPAMAKTRQASYRYSANENDYYFYLKQGFHISPSAGQDNHYPTWGMVTDARTGVVCSSLSEVELYKAFRANRTFATEDKNLSVILRINDKIMGSSITATDGSDLKIEVQVKDEDEPDAKYAVYLYSGQVNAEMSTSATDWKAQDGQMDEHELDGNGTLKIDGMVAVKAATFYYVKVVQDGDDRAWSAPVWVNEPKATNTTTTTTQAAKYVWTSGSSAVYHVKGCTAVDRISPENRVTGNTPPAGRRQHDCTLPDEH